MPIREYETEDHPGETAGERVIIEVDSGNWRKPVCSRAPDCPQTQR